MRYLLAILLMLFPLICPAQETEAPHIRPGDRLHISVRREPEISCSVVVRSDGSISIPLLNDIKVEGLTKQEMQELLAERLQRFVTNPEVTVTNFDQPKPATLPAIWPFTDFDHPKPATLPAIWPFQEGVRSLIVAERAG